uniref:Uncharacterized protein n=1 Tax=Sus scrofa TaxID=9823 RepID=A0A8D1LCG0_PIG
MPSRDRASSVPAPGPALGTGALLCNPAEAASTG